MTRPFPTRFILLAVLAASSAALLADTTPHALSTGSLTQNWTNIGLITTSATGPECRRSPASAAMA